MNCKRTHKLIDKSIDGLISQEQQFFLNEHLSGCKQCSEEYAGVVGLDGVLAEALPLQATLGDGFAARVAERLPARASRLSILKEAFVMSRLKYAVLVFVLAAVAIGCLFAPRTGDNQALAAVQSAMARVKSLHYKIDAVGPAQPHWSAPEMWSTRDAFKQVDRTGWHITKGGVQYDYNSRSRILFILDAPVADIGEAFGMMVDPMEILRIKNDPSVRVTVRDTECDGKPMQQIDVEDDRHPSKESSERHMRLARKMGEIIAEQEGRPAVGIKVTRARRLKPIFLVDPSTSLVRSVDYYAPNQEGGSRTPVFKVRYIDYNIDLPKDFFDAKTPAGAKVYDLRADPDAAH